MVEGIELAVGGVGYFSSPWRTRMLDKILDLHVETFRCRWRGCLPPQCLWTLPGLSGGFFGAVTIFALSTYVRTSLGA